MRSITARSTRSCAKTGRTSTSSSKAVFFMPYSLQYPADDHRHVVMLLGAAREGLGSGDKAIHHFPRRQAGQLARRLDHGVLTPFFVIGIHRFADAVGEGHESVAGL